MYRCGFNFEHTQTGVTETFRKIELEGRSYDRIASFFNKVNLQPVTITFVDDENRVTWSPEDIHAKFYDITLTQVNIDQSGPLATFNSSQTIRHGLMPFNILKDARQITLPNRGAVYTFSMQREMKICK